MWQPTMNSDEYLIHHGILGMKWGVRRYQNKDGSLTAEGKRHVKAYNTSQDMGKRVASKYSKVNEEGNKLIKKSKGLSKDFGGKHENIDDPEYFELAARERKLNTKDYWDAYTDYKKSKNELKNFNSLNKNAIKKGKKIVESGYSTKPASEIKSNESLGRKIAISLTNVHNNRLDRSNAKIQKDIDSFKGHENGIYDKNGNLLVSKEEVASSINALKKVQEKNKSKRWY